MVKIKQKTCKKTKAAPVYAVLAFVLFLSGCGDAVRTRETSVTATPARYEFTRDVEAVDYSGVTYTPWEADAAAERVGVREPKDYTIMIYMNGSDLESENGAATSDLLEMLESGIDTERFNVLIFTGGTYRWHNDAIPARDCVLWRLEDGGVEKIASAGLRNMGDAGTLAGFIEVSLRCFPAERYGLIFWDHGGGSIAGYGHDELFNNSTMTLLEIDYALQEAMPDGGEKLEFIGFDACLMATVEMAVVASRYAKYLIASEDLEPGDGWDYRFFGELNSAQDVDGAAFGRLVTDYYVDYYGFGTTDSITMSVTDLSRAGEVMGAMGVLMARCGEVIYSGRVDTFERLSRRRYATKAFGTGTRRDGDCDMVDIGDMARRLSDIFPEEASALTAALRNAVVYNRHNSMTGLGGLTAYYIFGGSKDSQNALETYEALQMSAEYTQYLRVFAGLMSGGDFRAAGSEALSTRTVLVENSGGRLRLAGQREAAASDGLWPAIGGQFICMEEIGQTQTCVTYAVPVRVNGEDADLIIVAGGEYPDGVIVGTRREDGYIIQKGYDKLEDGDRISFYYRVLESDGGGETWVLSDAMTVRGSLELTRRAPDTSGGVFSTGLLTTDIALGEHLLELDRTSAA